MTCQTILISIRNDGFILVDIYIQNKLQNYLQLLSTSIKEVAIRFFQATQIVASDMAIVFPFLSLFYCLVIFRSY